MSDYIVAPKQDLVNIADAIREKIGTTGGMKLDEMPASISSIETGGKPKTCSLLTQGNGGTLKLAYLEANDDGVTVKFIEQTSLWTSVNNVVCNSFVFIFVGYIFGSLKRVVPTNATILYLKEGSNTEGTYVVCRIDAAEGERAKISLDNGEPL